MLVRISKEAWLGGVLHTNGLGINYTNAKFKTYKKKSLLNIDLININHNKEYKIFGSFDENAKKFVYGKLNSLYSLRIGVGSRKIVFEKLRQNGVQIARGVDRFKYHEVINRTKFLMSEEGMLIRKRENDHLKKIFYNGSNKIGKF